MFRDLIVEMALLPERWNVRGLFLCHAFRQVPDHSYGIEINTGFLFGEVKNRVTGSAWLLGFNQNRKFKKLIRSLVKQREFERQEQDALEIHRLTTQAPSETERFK